MNNLRQLGQRHYTSTSIIQLIKQDALKKHVVCLLQKQELESESKILLQSAVKPKNNWHCLITSL